MIPYLDLTILHAGIRSELDAAWNTVLDSAWFIQGEQLAAFEKEWANYCGVNSSAGCANGLDALRLVLEAWKIQGKLKPGDEVLVPSNTYIATWLAVTQAGLIPIPVEPNPDTLTVEAVGLEEKISPRTRVILPVHLYGRIAPMPEIMNLAESAQLLVLGDAAQAHGASWQGKKTGAWGHAEAFSFYPGKNLGALGDAGAVCSSDEDLIRLIKTLGNYGSEKKYHNLYLGFNSRLDELQAAILRVKLRELDEWNRERLNLADRYLMGIQNEFLRLPADAPAGQHVWHIFQVQTLHRAELQLYLQSAGVGYMIHYPIPPHQQPAYAKEFPGQTFPISESIHAHTLSIPLFPGLEIEKQDIIIQVLNQFTPKL